jgi:tetratricopeptide (TPR) repeat protein
VEAALSRALGRITAMEGNFDEARDLMQRGREPLAEAGLLIHYWSTSQGSASVEEAAGNRDREEEILREAVKRLDELGERPYYSTNAVTLAGCLAAQHRDDEALEWAEISRRASPAGDVVNFISADAVEARILARRGELEAAERLAHATVERAEDTDFWRIRSTAYEALGEVLTRAGKRDEACAAYEHAVHICEEKGAVPSPSVRER